MISDYSQGLNDEKNKKVSNAAQNNVKNFYLEHKNFCDKAYLYYKEYEQDAQNYVSTPQIVKPVDFVKNIGKNIIFILTANPIEEGVLLHSLADNYRIIINTYMVENCVYHVINTDEYTIIHNHAIKTGDEYTRRSINAATKLFSPCRIILLGVCYGIDIVKHELGTILISSDVKSFRVNFRDQDEGEETFFEAETEFAQQPNEDMIIRIKNFYNYFQPTNEFFSLETSLVRVKIACGLLVSSNSLMSSKKVKDAVVNSLTVGKEKPLGGEMEAAGIFKSNYFEEKKFDYWLVIKGICDWGEKKNALGETREESEKIKDSIQAYAMINAWMVLKSMIEKDLIIDKEEE